MGKLPGVMGASQGKPEEHTTYAASSASAGLITEDEIKQLRLLHAHVRVADADTQKKAACLLANLAENDQNQETIVAEGGLDLLVPLMESPDREVQRLAV